MWGCIGQEGAGYATRIEGKMDAQLYTDILDNPKHTSKLAKKWFEDQGFKILVWPAQLLDLNPIEHLWNYLKRRLNEYEIPPKGLHELWNRVVKK